MDADDDAFDRRYPQHHQYRWRSSSPFETRATSPTLDSILSVADSMTNTNFVILFTCFLVALFHFGRPIIARLRILQTGEWSFVDIWLDLVETIKFYLDAGWNVMLNVLIAVSDNDLSQNSQESQPGINSERRTKRLSNVMPELEEATVEATHSLGSIPNVSSTEIEPSFLDPKDYPTGWLIYDPKLGIVRQEEAFGNGVGAGIKIDSSKALDSS